MIPSFNKQLENALPDLWRYAWSLTRDQDLADDLVQDCVERALKKRMFWFPGRPLKPWLTKILLNIYRDQWRRKRHQQSVAIDQISNIAEFSSNPEERIQLREVWSCIERIPEDQKQALLCVVVAGLSYNEAASTLGIPKGTLMSRLARAREKLRTELNNVSSPKIRSVK